jgi:HAD superfamily hydrolase (TIGR01509 family)
MANTGSLVAVIFDLGDTLVHLKPPTDEGEYAVIYERVLKAVVSRYPAATSHLSAKLLRNVGGRVGQQIAQSYAPEMAERLRERDAPTMFRAALAEFAPDFQPSDALLRFLIAAEEQVIYRPELAAGAVETLRALRERGIRTGLCSNYFGLPAVARANVHRMGLLAHLDQTVFSCEVGWRKPDPAIYQAICRKLAVRPSQCLFVGDRLVEDVRGPQQLGMRAALAQHFRQEQIDSSIARPDFILSQLDQVIAAVTS